MVEEMSVGRGLTGTFRRHSMDATFSDIDTSMIQGRSFINGNMLQGRNFAEDRALQSRSFVEDTSLQGCSFVDDSLLQGQSYVEDSSLQNRSFVEDNSIQGESFAADTSAPWKDESGIDLQCREDAIFWSPAPLDKPTRSKKTNRVKRRMARFDKKKINRTPLRRNDRIRKKSKTETPDPLMHVKMNYKLCKTRHMSISVSSSPEIIDYPPLPKNREESKRIFSPKFISPCAESPLISVPDEYPHQNDISSDDDHMSALVEGACTPEQIASPDASSDVICYIDETEKDLATATADYDNFGFSAYEQDIYVHRRKIELNYHAVDSLRNQPQVTTSMRAILAEWLTKINHSLELKFDTLFLMMNIVDRFLITTPIASNCVQLLGLTAVLIAAKMNELFPPTIPELLKTSSEKYSKEQMRQLERLVLVRLKFDLLAPTAIFFSEYYAADRIRREGCMQGNTRAIMKVRILARYLLELALQDYNLCQFTASLLGLVALEQSERILHSVTGSQGGLYGHSRGCVRECTTEFQPIVEGLLSNCVDTEDIIDKYTLAFGSPDEPIPK